MDNFHFHTLLHKYLSNQISPEELLQFTTAVGTGEYDHLLQEAITGNLGTPGQHWPTERQEAVLQDILQEIAPPVVKKRPVMRGIFWQAAAAVLLLGIGWGIYKFNVPARETPAVQVAVADISAGQHGAVLVLANGQKVVLDSAANGALSAQTGVNAVLSNGELTYGKDKDASTAMNTIITPRGRQFIIVLPDGSRVWINAGSSLRFPVSFTDKERRVELNGEAYFEVVANEASPFKVAVNVKSEVLVLGTSFNINAYEGEAAMLTTLVSGKVNVKTGGLAVMLTPGQQARVNNSITIMEDADVEKALAWKNGAFNFNNATIAEVAAQLERWYDIEVTYDKNISQIPFSGKISRKASLKTLLKFMDDTALSFRLEADRKLVISLRK